MGVFGNNNDNDDDDDEDTTFVDDGSDGDDDSKTDPSYSDNSLPPDSIVPRTQDTNDRTKVKDILVQGVGDDEDDIPILRDSTGSLVPERSNPNPEEEEGDLSASIEYDNGDESSKTVPTRPDTTANPIVVGSTVWILNNTDDSDANNDTKTTPPLVQPTTSSRNPKILAKKLKPNRNANDATTTESPPTRGLSAFVSVTQNDDDDDSGGNDGNLGAAPEDYSSFYDYYYDYPASTESYDDSYTPDNVNWVWKSPDGSGSVGAGGVVSSNGDANKDDNGNNNDNGDEDYSPGQP